MVLGGQASLGVWGFFFSVCDFFHFGGGYINGIEQ